jgi:hypothetical protein
VGSKKDEDVSNILHNTCFQCDARVFVPNKTTTAPHPMASIRLSDGSVKFHYVCVMCDPLDQDTPGRTARAQIGFDVGNQNGEKIWEPVSEERKRDDTKSF